MIIENALVVRAQVAAVTTQRALAPSETSVPSELRTLPAWLLWCYLPATDGKKPRKVPYYATNKQARHGAQGTSDDRSQLVTFKEAAKVAGDGYGLGIAMLPEWNLVGLDFDNCVTDGVVRPDVEALLAGTYAEFSPSGTGVRAFMRGEVPDKKSRKAEGVYGFETFHSKGFLTITGNMLPICELVGGGEITGLTDEVRALCVARFGTATRAAPAERESTGDPLMTFEPTLGWSANEQRVCLDKINVDDLTYDEWVKTGMALHHENGGNDTGLTLWDEWSARGASYVSREDLEHRYVAFGRGCQRPVTMRFLRRKARDAAPDTLVLDLKSPMRSARHFVERHHDSDQGRTLHCLNRSWYTHAGGRYVEVDGDVVRASIYGFLDKALKPVKNSLVPFDPDMREVTRVVDALRSEVIVSSGAQPFWLNGYTGPEARDICSMINGLLHLPSRQLLSHTPGFFTVNSVPYAWDPRAPAPVEWLKFLDMLWHDDPEMVEAVQEMFGYLLTTDTSQQKMFLMLGPKRSGKGTIARVLSAMIGQHNVVSPTLDSMATQFGLQQLIGKQLAIIPDARLGPSDHKLVEKLLQVSGEDGTTVERKNIAHWTGKLPTRFIIITNEMPRFTDASGAITSRFIVLETRRSFYGREDKGLEARLMAEMPAILAWAMDGRDRLVARGRFIQPASVGETVEEFEALNSPISEFLKECCAIGPLLRVPCKALFHAWSAWCADQGVRHGGAGTVQLFGRDLRAAVPGLSKIRPRSGNREREYVGIALLVNFDGLD